ncbi:MAG: hypothetical protein C0401_04025 [Anaerolinea sp.]|nr:hypothetical protein [Anaerolinea sp.]
MGRFLEKQQDYIRIIAYLFINFNILDEDIAGPPPQVTYSLIAKSPPIVFEFKMIIAYEIINGHL